MTRRRLIWLLLALVVVALWWRSRPSGESLPADESAIDWRREPIQDATDRAPLELSTRQGPVTLKPRAAYDVAAVVASRERYRFDDPALVSPLDLVLTWGEMPTPAYRDKLDYSQSWRFFFWRTEDMALDAGYVIQHTANTHIIPASVNVERALLAVDPGDAVRLVGLLVDVQAPGFRWETSLVRGDHGDRGCEILYVESAQVGQERYR